jgi:hypothetical protein
MKDMKIMKKIKDLKKNFLMNLNTLMVQKDMKDMKEKFCLKGI